MLVFSEKITVSQILKFQQQLIEAFLNSTDMSEENKENRFNHVKTFTKIIFIFSVLVFNDNESKITDAAVNLFIQI